jgi:hypothetical protein
VARRGTTNSNARGNTKDRAARRRWLVTSYRADRDITDAGCEVAFGTGTTACRCYRCGVLLTESTVTVDRIVPGCQGGTYQRNNIRPACLTCNSETGGRLATRTKVATEAAEEQTQ